MSIKKEGRCGFMRVAVVYSVFAFSETVVFCFCVFINTFIARLMSKSYRHLNFVFAVDMRRSTLRSLFYLFLSGRFRQVLLYNVNSMVGGGSLNFIINHLYSNCRVILKKKILRLDLHNFIFFISFRSCISV